MPDRVPLYPITDEALREALNRAKGLDKDMLPFSLTHEERRAALEPGLPARQEKPMQPLIPAKVAVLAASIGGLLILGSNFAASFIVLPAWVAVAAWGLGAFALFLAGQAVPAPKFVRPGVGASLVPLFAAIGAAVRGLSEAMNEPWKTGLVIVAGILVGLAGQVAPQAVVPTGELEKELQKAA